jgi:hypothetical protein
MKLYGLRMRRESLVEVAKKLDGVKTYLTKNDKDFSQICKSEDVNLERLSV